MDLFALDVVDAILFESLVFLLDDTVFLLLLLFTLSKLVVDELLDGAGLVLLLVAAEKAAFAFAISSFEFSGIHDVFYFDFIEIN
jgi:hypothetical protein